MPSISTQQVKEKRQAIKKLLGKEWKVSVRRERGSTISVALLSGPLEYPHQNSKYCQVNDYYIDRHYREQPEWLEILNAINDICRGDMSGGFHDSDYGYVPGHYVDISIGQWDRPYTQKVNGQVIEAPATEVAKEIDEPALPVISARPATQVAPEKKPVLRLVPPAPQQSAQADLMEMLGL